MQKYFVFLHKPSGQVGHLVKPLSEIINVSQVWARNLLLSEIPYHRVATFNNLKDAQHLVNQLKSLGVKAVVLSYKEYKNVPRVLQVKEISFGEKLSFVTDSNSYTLFPNYAKVIFKGRYHRWSERSEIVRDMKAIFDLRIYSLEKEILRRARIGFLLIYGATDKEVFEINERNFVCNELRDKHLLTSALRFARLCEMIKKFFKGAIWDERFWWTRIPAGRASKHPAGVAFIREATDRRQVLIASKITYRLLTEFE